MTLQGRSCQTGLCVAVIKGELCVYTVPGAESWGVTPELAAPDPGPPAGICRALAVLGLEQAEIPPLVSQASAVQRLVTGSQLRALDSFISSPPHLGVLVSLGL